MTSKIFDKYQVVRRIAVGGMGEVFLARQTGIPGFERPVILKALLAGEAAPPQLVTRFLDEARLVATLNHPNVVSVFEAGLWNGTFYMAMEYIAGWNLVQLKREADESGRPVPLGLVVRVVHDAALGLDHAHFATDAKQQAQHIVHRDVSPHNIMVRKDGHTKVVDFGVAWALNRDSKTQTGAVVGKLSYMSPEQLRGQLTDARTDQFALGIVLWELLTGRRMYAAGNEGDLARQVLTARIEHPSDVAAHVPRPLGDVAMHMLAEHPDRRYPRCLDAARELDAAAAQLHLDSSTSTVEAWLEPMLPVPAERVEQTGADFVVQLKSPTPGETSPESPNALAIESSTAAVTSVPPARSRALPIALVVTAAVALAAGGYALANREPTVVVVEPQPAVVKVPVETPPPAPAQVAATVPAVIEPTPAPKPVPAKPRTAARKPTEPPPPPKAEPQGRGWLTIATDPWSRVTVDGRVIGSTPLNKIELSAGAHDLLMENADEHVSKRQRIVVTADQTLKLDLDLSR